MEGLIAIIYYMYIYIYICNNKIKKLALLNAIIQKEIALKNYFPCA